MIHVFIGVDKRQPIAAQVLAHSIYDRAKTQPVSITQLRIETLPVKRKGLTEFTFTRYLVPWLCGYEGTGIFVDADMLVLADIAELASYNEHPVSVVKGKLRFEWPSMMVFNNPKCRNLTPELIETGEPQTLSWAESIGEIPAEWNHCVGYDHPNPKAKLVHFTQGIPCFPETQSCEYAEEWAAEHVKCNSTVSWASIMGNSVHARPVLQRMGLAV